MKKRYRYSLISLAVLVIVLIVARLLLASAVLRYLNHRFAVMGDYQGQIADIDIHLWRGAYTLRGLTVNRMVDREPVPLLNAPRIDIALSWNALRRGVVRTKIDFFNAELNFVDSRGKGGSQNGKGVDWRAELEHLTPVRIDQLTVHDSTVTFRNFVSDPPVDLRATHVEATVTNLSNANGGSVATADLKSDILGQAPMTLHAEFNPLEAEGDFKFDLKVLHVDLTRANDFARAYAGVDFSGGRGDFVMQLAARDKELHGYAKPIFHDLKVFSWKKDVEQEHKNPLQVAWSATVQGVTWIFKNHDKDQFATLVPIEGRIDQRSLSRSEAIINVLKNAFVKAYAPSFEHLPEDKGASDKK
ncbi:DUF748 domain-containing protein [Dyella sp.]|uniref:DUF748 domain-containing protein n=1 Tax=Dyella sp. TaxID=1869338 RepID=UPI002ED4B87A